MRILSHKSKNTFCIFEINGMEVFSVNLSKEWNSSQTLIRLLFIKVLYYLYKNRNT